MEGKIKLELKSKDRDDIRADFFADSPTVLKLKKQRGKSLGVPIYRDENERKYCLCPLRAKKFKINFIVLIFIAVFLFSCSVKHVQMPSYEGVDVKDIIAERSAIKSVEAVFSVEFERGNSLTTGEAAVDITEKAFDMRIYSSGFLVGEIMEKEGEMKSKPQLSKNKLLVLVQGLRNGIFWWMIDNYEIVEQNGLYHLKSSARKISIDKKTMLPTQQRIEMDDGRELKISYDEPDNNDGIWYQSSMKIEFLNYVVRLHIKRISFISSQNPYQQQPSL